MVAGTRSVTSPLKSPIWFAAVSFSTWLIGGPTAVLEYAGLRWLTDPTFSARGEYAGGLVKTAGPVVPAEEIGPIDVMLVSHDHHADNFDPGGRELVAGVGHVLTNTAGAERLGGDVAGLDPWETVDTLSSDRAAEAALILGAPVAIPLHFEGWSHFTQARTSCAPRFTEMGSLTGCGCSRPARPLRCLEGGPARVYTPRAVPPAARRRTP